MVNSFFYYSFAKYFELVMKKKVNIPKKSLIVSYDKLTTDLKMLLNEQYPEGYQNYVTRYPKPNGDVFFAVRLDTPDVNYLVKVDVKIDNVFTDSDFDKHFLGDTGVDGKSFSGEDGNDTDDNIDSMDVDNFVDDAGGDDE